jgi:hypothetical protein
MRMRVVVDVLVLMITFFAVFVLVLGDFLLGLRLGLRPASPPIPRSFSSSSASRQHFLYFFFDPQVHSSLRPRVFNRILPFGFRHGYCPLFHLVSISYQAVPNCTNPQNA